MSETHRVIFTVEAFVVFSFVVGVFLLVMVEWIRAIVKLWREG